jgi:hypothetical protein
MLIWAQDELKKITPLFTSEINGLVVIKGLVESHRWYWNTPKKIRQGYLKMPAYAAGLRTVSV